MSKHSQVKVEFLEDYHGYKRGDKVELKEVVFEKLKQKKIVKRNNK